jgi:hypothetical protein
VGDISDVLLPFTARRAWAVAEVFGENRYSPEVPDAVWDTTRPS